MILLYLESELGRTISAKQNIHISALSPFPQLEGDLKFLKVFYPFTIVGLPAVLLYGLKIVWQFGTIVVRLCQLPKPDFICVQVRFCFFFVRFSLLM